MTAEQKAIYEKFVAIRKNVDKAMDEMRDFYKANQPAIDVIGKEIETDVEIDDQFCDFEWSFDSFVRSLYGGYC